MDNLKKHIQANRDQMDLDIPEDFVWENIQNALDLGENDTEKKAAPIFSIKRIAWLAAACLLTIVGYFSWKMMNNTEEITNHPSLAKNDLDKKVNTDSPTQSQMQTLVIQKDTSKIEPKEAPILVKNEETPVKKEFKLKEKQVLPTKKSSKVLYAKAENIEVGNFSQLIDYQKEIINTIPILGVKPSYFNAFKTQLKSMDQDEKSIRMDIAQNGISQVAVNQLINIYQQKINVLKQLSDEISRTNKIYSQHEVHPTKPSIHYLNL
ncbi:hypothetical protein [Rhizosphaericola mali]|uniref:Uncharacterized protein n=1 Tax=Rhizosphaericola mali TaxID=2545455 RepID=A0A5P2G250_9BACT|nr:hypothetical protein [Rhizosphaericola mali]QES88169.1 hypothetical protein E0W69_005640 [Rhizosphaericola mali]